MAELKIAALENRTVLTLRGADVWSFLQNLVTNDMQDVSETHGIYAALLTAQGKFLHDFIIVRIGEAYLLDCLADRKDDLIRRLTLYKLRADVLISEEGQRVFALFGNDAFGAANLPETSGALRESGGCAFLVDPRNNALGVRLFAPTSFDPVTEFPTADLVGEDAYDAHRLSLGIPEGGHDILPEKNFLLEANFEELNGVSFTKGCYVGQELTARTKHRAKIKKRLFRIEYDGELHSGDKIMHQGREIAEVRSISNGRGLALVRLNSLAVPPEELEPKGVKLIQPNYIDLPLGDP
ncbi:YgfZ/GcvT domain-containing protein [Sneathiella litorea]|uniref:CAF17-like 4Fe-4S cluster assembly/insertion protein YgfZ n=1 Tax=Sneathiella litorea TaxID=2606216 RepID=UPI00136CF097|nr:folate-binding protein YgfZ [Sneathiella litorea]